MFLLLLFACLSHNATQAMTIQLERECQRDALFPRLGDQYFDNRTVWSIAWAISVCSLIAFALSMHYFARLTPYS